MRVEVLEWGKRKSRPVESLFQALENRNTFLEVLRVLRNMRDWRKLEKDDLRKLKKWDDVIT